MYRRIFTYFRDLRNFTKLRTRACNFRRAAPRLYAPPCLLALSGFSINDLKDCKLTDDDIKEETEIIEAQDKLHKGVHGWETLVEEPDLRVYRRLLPGKRNLYEYKCSGTYYDITPQNFVDAQCDVQYRREWDSNVLELDVLAEDDETDSQVVRWVAKYPYPMYPRVYIYVRRMMVDNDAQKIVVYSQVVDEKVISEKSSNVRVTTYRSFMIINAHKSFNENGLDYVLTYHDDPQAHIPNTAYNWIVNRGGPYFLKQVHAAAKQLEEEPLRTPVKCIEPMKSSDESSNPSDGDAIPNYSAA